MKNPLRTIYPFAWLAFREAVHSRIAAAAALLSAAIVAIVFRASGPLEDEGAHNFLFYATAGCEAVLSLCALIAGSAPIAGEREGKTLKLVRVKPAAMWKFWLGRWLGLVAIFALLLAFALALIGAGAACGGGPGLCSRKVAPFFPSIREEAEAIVQSAKDGGTDDPSELAAIRREALQRLPFASAALGAGEEWSVRFRLGRPLEAAHPVALCLAFSSDSFSPVPLSVSGLIENAAGTAATRTFAVTNITRRLMKIAIDPAPIAGEEALVMRLRHGGESQMPLLMQPRQGIFLMVPECGSAFNFLRAFALFLPVLSLLAALGLALGSLFSLPVAVFCAAGLAVSVMSAGYTASDPDLLEDGPSGSSIVSRIPQTLSKITVDSLDFAARSAMAPAPAAMLAEARFIPSDEIVASVLWNGCAIPLVLMFISAAVLERKELSQ